MEITINPDFSATVVSADGAKFFGLPAYDPETTAPFHSEDEVRACAERLAASHPHIWMAVPAPEPAAPEVSEA